jgi:uncharacterized protein (DUF305 family)
MTRPSALAAVFSLLLAAGCGPTVERSTVDSHGDADSMHAAATGTVHSDMSAMNDRMVRELGPADSTYDDRFIDLMIPHHEGAVAMARDAREKAQHPELRAFADSIIAAQEREIRMLEEWRRAWYGH